MNLTFENIILALIGLTKSKQDKTLEAIYERTQLLGSIDEDFGEIVKQEIDKNDLHV